MVDEAVSHLYSSGRLLLNVREVGMTVVGVVEVEGTVETVEVGGTVEMVEVIDLLMWSILH